MKFKYNGRIVAARNKADACRKIAASARRVTAYSSIKKGDFVSYNTYDDGKSYNGYIPEYVWAKVIDVAADGKLTLATYDYEFHDEIDEVDPSRCRKLDHFGGMKNEREYYTGGKINIYAGYYEYILTEKELSKPYVFCGTIDTLDEHDEVECYNDESVYVDKDLEKSWDGLGIEFVDLSGKDSGSKATASARRFGSRRVRASARRVHAGAEKFIGGIVDAMEGSSSDKATLVSDTLSDTAFWAPSSDWEVRQYDGDKLVYDIKYKGCDSALDGIKLEGIRDWDILNQENQDFLESLVRYVDEEYGLSMYVYGRSGGWLGFDLDDFAEAKGLVKVSLKDDAETKKAIADEIRRLYGDDDTQFTGNESVEELVEKLDIDDYSEGNYVGGGNTDWFKAELSDEGYRVMKYVEDSIKSQCEYMMTKEWLDAIIESYGLVKGDDGVYRPE